MPSSLFKFRFWAIVLLIGSSLTGCTGMTGGMGRAWTVNGKCEAILDWVKRFEKEFPLRSIGLYGGQSPATVANLYRPEVFTPVFGFPYERTHEAEIKDVADNVLPYCSGEKKGVKAETVQAFRPLRKLVDAGFPFNDSLAREAGERIKNEAWRQKALSEISEIPATQDGFNNIRDYYLGTGEKAIQNLWASDQQDYLQKVKARRGKIAKILLDDFMPPPDMLPDYQASLDKIREAAPYLMALKESGDRDLRKLAESYEDRRRRIVVYLIEEEIDYLMTIPHNMDGFRLTREWFEEFQRWFSPYSDMEEMNQAVRTFQGKRQAIFENNRRLIYDRFSGLGFGKSAREKEEMIIAETFPLPSDYQLPFYREFRNNFRNKGNSTVLDLLDKSKNAVMNYYEAISGFAREMFEARPE